jgi:hypothetical protein
MRRAIACRSAAAVALGAALLLSAFACCAAAEAANAIWPAPDWQTAAPEDEGVDSAALAQLVAFGKTRSFDSLLIVRHGRVILDAYYAPPTAPTFRMPPIR